MKKETILIGGMSCEHCVKAVRDCVSLLDGVKKVKVSLKTNNAEAKFDENVVSVEKIKFAIKDAGYEVLN